MLKETIVTMDTQMSTSNLFKVNVFHCMKSCYQFPKLFPRSEGGRNQDNLLKITLKAMYADQVSWEAVLLSYDKYDPKLGIEAQHVATGNRQFRVGARIRIVFVQFSYTFGCETSL